MFPFDQILIIKCLPITLQFLTTLLSTNLRIFKHTIRTNPDLCPITQQCLAVDLESKINEIPSFRFLSHNVTKFQASLGLALTILTSSLLTNDIGFRTSVGAGLFVLLAVSWSSFDEPVTKSRIKNNTLAYSGVAAFFGIIVIWLSGYSI